MLTFKLFYCAKTRLRVRKLSCKFQECHLHFMWIREGGGVLNKTVSPVALIIYRNLELSEYLLVDKNTSFGNSVYSKRDDIEEVPPIVQRLWNYRSKS